jgi:hypothetical protein
MKKKTQEQLEILCLMKRCQLAAAAYEISSLAISASARFPFPASAAPASQKNSFYRNKHRLKYSLKLFTTRIAPSSCCYTPVTYRWRKKVDFLSNLVPQGKMRHHSRDY